MLAPEPGTTPGLVPASWPTPGPAPDSWPFLDLPAPGPSVSRQPLPRQLFSAIPPSREVGYSWPSPLKPHQSHRMAARQLPSVEEIEGEYSYPQPQGTSEETPTRGTQVDELSETRVKVKDTSRFETMMESLEEKFKNLQKSRLQEEELERIWGTQIDTMKSQYMVLDRAIGRLQNRLEDFKSFQTQIDRLTQEKVDKITMEQELKEKAEKSALASKANRTDLDLIATEMNEMVQSVLFKLSTHEADWKKALKQVKKDLATKLVSNDLEGIKKEIQELWHVVLKLVVDSLRFDPDRAAGFRKKLFERVKCISCDRPVTMMTSPQLITIRKTSRLRPASANGYEYLEQQMLREQKLQLQGMDPLSTQQDWGDGPRNTATRQKTYNMTTLYPYGDPEELDYDSAEVDILGVDGILYRGRMTPPTGTQPPAGEKELTAVKIPCPPRAQTPIDRVRPSAVHPPPSFPGYRTSDSSTSRPVSTMMARPPSLLPLLPLVIPPRGEPQQAPVPLRHQKSVPPEPRTSTKSTEESINLNGSK
ncbi:uncharacterized protein C16orf96-like isoform X2 [Dipodomys merriami]|uniref:uncharacterized protein C16orf96-like isoform X2 n=1 Tax=Dipodomys merriami TaxID=94247 RepID=UPI003855D460